MVSKQFKVPLGLVSLSTNPASPSTGDTYFNTSLNVIMTYNGSEWVGSPIRTSHTITSTSNTVVDSWDINLFTTVEYTIQIIQGTKFRSSKILALTNKSLIEYTEYGIISIGSDINGLLIDASVSPQNFGVLTIQISDANVSNAQVKVVKTTIS